ncbi:MAG: SDR family NAD(P)-dependent oxidoreductase, partial [Gemmatimonas sp.]|nr:SDR family NAD(P)-dependent oxidoreductase [Gemmatimonas sp.]
MRTLVTGGAGFIGSHLCERLIARGHEVVAIDNFDPFYDPAIKRANLASLARNDHFKLVEADIREPTALFAALHAAGVQELDLIIHLAACAGVRRSLERPLEYSRTNL